MATNSSNYSYVPYQVMDMGGTDLRATLLRYFRHWYWFILSTGLMLALAFFYLRYQQPTYKSQASLLVKDEKKGLDSESMLKELEIFAPKKVVENEIEVLKSYTLMDRVVKQLHLDVVYWRDTPFGKREIFNQSPIRLIVEQAKSSLYVADKPLKISFVNTTTVRIDDQLCPINSSVQTPYGRLRIFTRQPISVATEPVYVQVFSHVKVVNDYLRVLKAEPTSKASTVIMLSLETGVPDKGEVILNRLIDVYNEAAVLDKNRVASNTLNFIEERLQLVAGELETVEKGVERYKSAQGITDLTTQAQGFLETVQRNDAELSQVSIQLGTLRDIEEYIQQQPGNRNGTPATLGLSDPTLINLIQTATKLEVQRNELAQTVPEQNPLLRTINAQIRSVKADIAENVGTMRTMLTTAQRQFAQTNEKIEGTIRTIPAKERALLNITRQQAIKNELYTYLLRKREETAVSFASTISDSRVIDVARSDIKPAKPNQPLTYLLFLLIGLIIPVGFMATRDVVNNRVIRRTDVEEQTQTPILGEIVRKRSPDSLVVSSRMHSVISEQIRALRTNLSFLRESRTGSQVLLFTSSINGEGKSFLSLNLGASLALVGSRTVILEMDLRKPQLRNSLDLADGPGLSNYLIGESAVDALIQPIDDNENYYIIRSGPLPPNPSELLSSSLLEKLIIELRERFDYVIIDAPPVGLVTDAQLIAPFADATLYIVRHDVTPRNYLKMVEMLHREKRFNKLNIVLNGVGDGEPNYYSYGHKGYAYGTDDGKKKTLLSRLRSNS
ncbi:GumC family protein [Spirosoma utsteinense]|uniref:Capsular exopolysaccharide synthesis family protein n=1 Tax=Spirosoma utsteinense TaxID=2585773 RepID=A0ABR6W7N4_9BACT|nr:tyrosine-protein kinase [Spirosoma utsteinense]MBC3783954.1 capsular exopolysaccharide synthesis family protein [Spirosoma utsteinense]MBC3792588.1 capsular exopolysaccharide synthesis family protein [Spirosoma utsteinense]